MKEEYKPTEQELSDAKDRMSHNESLASEVREFAKKHQVVFKNGDWKRDLRDGLSVEIDIDGHIIVLNRDGRGTIDGIDIPENETGKSRKLVDYLHKMSSLKAFEESAGEAISKEAKRQSDEMKVGVILDQILS